MVTQRTRCKDLRTGDAPTAGWSGICECGLCKTSPTCWATRSPGTSRRFPRRTEPPKPPGASADHALKRAGLATGQPSSCRGWQLDVACRVYSWADLLGTCVERANGNAYSNYSLIAQDTAKLCSLQVLLRSHGPLLASETSFEGIIPFPGPLTAASERTQSLVTPPLGGNGDAG
jgi:hypothetical protein